MKFSFFTLGCKVNQYESEEIAEQLEHDGYETVMGLVPADIYIINTCTVTNIADRKSRQMIRRTKQINPDSILVVMGCYSQVAPDDIKKIKEVQPCRERLLREMKFFCG